MANSYRTKGILPVVLGSLSIATGAIAADQDQTAAAPTARTASAAMLAEDIGTIEVTGYRLSLRNAIDMKKNASVMMDAINAEDIADFPDANLAESLQRLPGVALDRDNGEGRGITVRGLGSDFTRVRLNGLETLSTAAASDSGTSPNRGRGFDFNVFASDLFSFAGGHQDRLGVRGRRLARRHRRPRDRQAARLQGHASSRFPWKMRITKTAARTTRASPDWLPTQFFDDKFGVSLSGAYSERTSEVDRYKRQAGQSDYEYRGSTFARHAA